jgi:hypothetical protein
VTPRWKIRRVEGPFEGIPVWQIFEDDYPREYFYVWENAVLMANVWAAA